MKKRIIFISIIVTIIIVVLRATVEYSILRSRNSEQTVNPIYVNEDNVAEIKICIQQGESDKLMYYVLNISDEQKIRDLILKLKYVKAYPKTESNSLSQSSFTYVYIFFYGYDELYYDEIRMQDNGVLSLHEGGIDNTYVVSEEGIKEIYRYIQDLCKSDPKFKEKYNLTDSWEISEYIYR